MSLRQQTFSFLNSEGRSTWSGQQNKTPQLLGETRVGSVCDHAAFCWRMGGFGQAGGGYSLVPFSLGALVVSYQRPEVLHSFPNASSIQQPLCAVPPPLLTVPGLLLLPADSCVFLETSPARHVSSELQLCSGDGRR